MPAGRGSGFQQNFEEHAATEVRLTSVSEDAHDQCEYNSLERAYFHLLPARCDNGLQQIFGDVWEWTASAYTGYPGYYPLRGALVEYNEAGRMVFALSLNS
jgi:formylglycine-generating enzyme required for sulfatase activity